MEALYDRFGRVRAWLDAGAGHILAPDGRPLAFIDRGSVYGWTGRHLGWWRDGHMRDGAGAVAVCIADAAHLGVAMPALAPKPAPPARGAAPGRPAKDPEPARPANKPAWSAYVPF